jgi:hypothetical protein
MLRLRVCHRRACPGDRGGNAQSANDRDGWGKPGHHTIRWMFCGMVEEGHEP